MTEVELTEEEKTRIMNISNSIRNIQNKLSYHEDRCVELNNQLNILRATLNDFIVSLSIKYKFNPDNIRFVNGKIITGDSND